MVQNREPFLSRWSRRKRASADAAPAPKLPAQAEGPPPELPPIDSLTPESDFSAFMHKQVDEKLRRAALAKLFSDPAFNVVDGLDDYAEDYTQLETLADERYLRKVPVDPVTERSDTWVVVPPEDTSQGGVYDVHSGAPGNDEDGKPYKDL